MRKLSFLLMAVLFFVACQTKNAGYKISGEIKGIGNDEKVYLYDTDIRKDIDSVLVVDGKFEFTGSVDNISHYLILYRVKGENPRYASIWVDNVPVKVNGTLEDFENLSVEGSEVQDQEKELIEFVKPYKEKMDSISSVYNPANAEEAQRLYDLYEQVNADMNVAQIDFVKKHPEYYFSVYLLERLIREMDTVEGEEVYGLISEQHKSTTYAKNIERYLTLNKNLKAGDNFADLSLPNAQGEQIGLGELIKGKYALIDFWASWCNPCRGENPNLRQAYEQYHDRGFEIYAVSLDKKKEDWLKAVAEDNITWTTVIDTLAFDSDAAMMYSVKYIPHNFLISPEGEILAIDLRGNDFLNKMAEVFAE